jgi:hypothetical protein
MKKPEIISRLTDLQAFLDDLIDALNGEATTVGDGAPAPTMRVPYTSDASLAEVTADAPPSAPPLGAPCQGCETLMAPDAEKCPRCGAPADATSAP